MKLFTAKYENYEIVNAAIKKIFQESCIGDVITEVFIGKTSMYHNMCRKRKGLPPERLTYSNALICVITISVLNDEGSPCISQITLANDSGILNGFNNPGRFGLNTYLAICKDVKKHVEEKYRKTKLKQEEQNEQH